MPHDEPASLSVKKRSFRRSGLATRSKRGAVPGTRPVLKRTETMIHPTKWFSRLLFVLAAGLGVGSVLFAFWPLVTLRLMRPGWSETTVLLWEGEQT